MKRRRFAIAGVAAVIAVAAAALAVARLVGEEEQRPRDWDVNLAIQDPSAPDLIGERVVITRGEDWAFGAWRSTLGLCTSLVFRQNEGGGGTSCGMPIVGAAPETGGSEHLVVGGYQFRADDDDLWVDGVVVADASRVEVELSDGRRVQAPIYDAPAALGLDLKFFLVRTRPPEEEPRVEVPLVRAFSAYDADGRLLERFGPPTAR